MTQRSTAAGKPLFALGQVVATPAAIEFCEAHAVHILDLVRRHCHGDFGEMNREDITANTEAIKSGARIFSSYKVGTTKVWVITESNRSSTCVLLPEEY